MFYNANRGKGKTMDAGDFFPSLSKLSRGQPSSKDMKIKVEALMAHIQALRKING